MAGEFEQGAYDFRSQEIGEVSPKGNDLDLQWEEEEQKASTQQDAADMRRLGKKQELKRNFHSFSTLGLTTIVMNTWVAMITSIDFPLMDGGRAGTIWVFLASWILSMCSTASLAEMASMAPTSAGQYHWISEFAPASAQKALSYIGGWLAALGWQVNIAYCAYATGNLILYSASLRNPSYVPTIWQGTLIMICIGLLVTIFNSWGAKRLPLFEGCILLFDIIGFFAILIPLWVLAPMAPAREVFGSFANYGNWPTVGVACLVGQVACAGSLIGVDAAAHMSEEVNNASLTVPWMMFGTIILNGVLGFVMVITYVFVIQNLETQIVDSTSPYPFISVFEVAVGSKAGAIGMTVPVIILLAAACVNSMAAASRQAWSFARDEGLPFPRWFKRVITVDGTPTPVNAAFASLALCIIFALLNLGGTEVFDSIIGLGTGALTLTYTVSIGSVLWRRFFGESLPKARWSLGKFGAPINVFACLYQMLVVVMSFFPLFDHTTAKEMNWAIVVFGGVVLLCSVNYIVRARKIYKGPVSNVNKE